MYLQIFNTKHYTFPNLSALGLFPGVYSYHILKISLNYSLDILGL